MKLFVKSLVVAAIATLGLVAAAPTMAGPATTALSQCLVRSATPQDNIVLVRWVFMMISKHPKVADLAAITPAEDEAINREMGGLFTRLLVESCGTETVAAIKADGDDAPGNAFGVMSEKAFNDLTNDPAVNEVSTQFVKYVDLNRFAQIIMTQPSK